MFSHFRKFPIVPIFPILKTKPFVRILRLLVVSAGLRLGRPPPAAMSQLEAFAGNLEMLDFFALIKGRCWAPRPLGTLALFSKIRKQTNDEDIH